MDFQLGRDISGFVDGFICLVELAAFLFHKKEDLVSERKPPFLPGSVNPGP